ncbi:uncharacterized protein LOC141617289 [Silene latifolia]|uniref:uncharacterized protein LOC141617289 n=1 Tax=Silene latifolia TaxID=37657 RepID=UPI003D78579F
MARPRGRTRGRPVVHHVAVGESTSSITPTESGEIRTPFVVNDLLRSSVGCHSRPPTHKSVIESLRKSGDVLSEDIVPNSEAPVLELSLGPGPKDGAPATATAVPEAPAWNKVVKPKVGMSLHYCQHSADSTEIDVTEDDVEGELKYWQYTLMGNVLGARPTVAQMQAYVTKSWNHVSLPAVQYFRRGWFSFRFTSAEDMDEVLKGGPWSLGSNSLVLKQWSPNFSMEMDKLSIVPIWILFPELDPVLWSDVVLSKLASKVGKPLYADMTTTCKARLSFARVLVEADLASELPEQVLINTPYHGQIAQPIVYEWKPYYCSCCAKLGHTANFCKQNKDGQPAKVWRKKPAPEKAPVSSPVQAPAATRPRQKTPSVGTTAKANKSGSSKDTGKSVVTSTADQEDSEVQLQNSYSVLTTEDSSLDSQEETRTSWADSTEPIPPDKDADSSVEHQGNKESAIFSQFSSYVVVSNKIQGRLWLFSNPATVSLSNIIIHEQFIHCDVCILATNQTLSITFVYAKNEPQERMALWDKLVGFSATPFPWVVMGDFNVVRGLSERVGPNPPAVKDIWEFNSCLAHCYLDDMHCLGSEYTWSNKQGPGTRTWARLDRVLINPKWLTMFPSSFASTLVPGISDHSPLLVTIPSAKGFKKRFSFLNIWQGHPDYLCMVETAWHTPSYGTPMFQLFHKLKAVRKALQLLHKKDFSDIQGRIKATKTALDACQKELQQDLFSPSLISQEKALTRHYVDLTRLEVDMLFQKAKIHNIRKGDCSSSYFFSKIAIRKHQSLLGLIQDKEGHVRYGTDDVNTAFVEYYTDLLGKRVAVEPIPEIVFSSGPTVSTDASVLLIAPVTRVEIKEALFSIGSTKSPGQDGFSSGFFKHSWDLVGDLFCSAVEEYFRKGKMMRKVNTTLLALVPKKDVPSTVQDFRPIACCSVVYKTISKIIANRLKHVLPDLVGNEQAAFIKGRNIFENIMMSQNLIKGYNQSLITPRCLIKVDIRKAFDSLQWEFIRDMLHGFKFPPLFVNWIMGCVASTWFSLKVNGTLSGFFPGKSGVRQGDPISPYIFVLSMEVLSRQLRRLYLLPQVSFHPKCAKLKLNHLVFADDLMIFMRGDVPSVAAVATCLGDFAKCSGLYANPSKTSVYYGGVGDEIKQQIGALTGYVEEQFPFRYLGIILHPGRLAPGLYKAMLDKIQKAIHHWTGNLLSYAGKLQLINAVLFGLENFWSSALFLPKVVIKLVNKLCKDYFWGTPPGKRKMTFQKMVFGIHGQKLTICLGLLIWSAQSKPHHAESWRSLLRIRDQLVAIAGDSGGAQAILNSCVRKGKFIVGFAYDIFRTKRGRLGWMRALSFFEILPKHKICTVQAAQGVLPTVDKIAARGYFLVNRCCLCENALESHRHLFFRCPYSQQVRRQMLCWLGLTRAWPDHDLRNWLYKLSDKKGKRYWQSALVASCLAGLVFTLWEERNNRIFRGEAKDSELVAKQLQWTLTTRLFVSKSDCVKNWLAVK